MVLMFALGVSSRAFDAEREGQGLVVVVVVVVEGLQIATTTTPIEGRTRMLIH
jgi:hypothetical protein